jgi:hypothetical protein
MSARSRRTVPSAYRRPRRRPRQRRGVILLVVLTILVLFTLIAITFVILSTQHKKTALADQRPLRYDDGYAELLTRAAMQALRGTDNPMSVIGHHSLLEDMYGNDTITGAILADPVGIGVAGFNLTNQFGRNTTTSTGAVSLLYIDVPLSSYDPTSAFKSVAGYYNGRVLTMLTGAAAGKSSRIVAYATVDQAPAGTPDGVAETGRLVLLPFDDMTVNAAQTGWNTQYAPQVGDRYLINGRPFNGPGFGFNPTNGNLDTTDGLTVGTTNRQFALLPFPPSPLDPVRYPEYTAYQTALAASGGISPDEDYDAVDFQNMLLAARIWTGSRWEVRLPSLVRPELMNYWAKRYFNAGTDLSQAANENQLAEILSRTFPRPVPMTGYGHINFTGSNPAFQLANFNTTIASFSQDLQPYVSGTSTPNGILDVMENIPWDVDNDGDGLPDSVWVDLGMPVQTAADGRRYKPLFALLVLDMDGRANLNAHGTNYQFTTLATPGPNGETEAYVYQNLFTGYFAGGNGATGTAMTTGSGSSPADVNLAALIPTPYVTSGGTTINEYRRLLQGGYPLDPITGDPDTTQPFIEGRYGESHLYFDGTNRLPQPGTTSATAASNNGPDGTAGTADDQYDGDDNRPPAPMYWVNGTGRYFSGNFYRDGFLFNMPMGHYGSPTDLDGNGTLGLDLNGQPITIYMGSPWTVAPFTTPEAVDDPTEINLFAGALDNVQTATFGQQQSVDRPFTPSELESLLRSYDADARTFPSRLEQLAPVMFNNSLYRQLLTTESWDVPAPPFELTWELKQWRTDAVNYPTQYAQMVAALPSLTNLHITDALGARIIAGMGYVPPFTSAQEAVVNFTMSQLLAPELASGLKLDINRLLGDGVDNDGDLVVDEPGEVTTPETLWNNSNTSPGTTLFDHNNDGDGGLSGTPYATDVLARHMLARQLFTLMMLLTDSGYAMLPRNNSADDGTGLTAAQRRELTVREIAQWAINVVDFRDRDNVMTPFEYDADPFSDGNGDGLPWDVDGWVGTNPVTGTSDDDVTVNTHRRLVWGCEYPDALITETLAFHDRRTEDLAAGGGKIGAGTDTTYDQQRIPQGSAFVELHCTRNPNNPAFSTDLYYYDTTNSNNPLNGSLDLGRMAPANATHGGQSPVWRLAVTYPHQDTALPEDGPDNNLAERYNGAATSRPLSCTLQPENMNALNGLPTVGLGTPEPAVNIERIVWMCTTPPPFGHPDEDRIYYNRASTTAGLPVLLPAGRYAVVGPHRAVDSGTENITPVGRSTTSPDDAQTIRLGNVASYVGAGARSAIDITDNDAATSSYPVSGTDILEPIGIPVGADHPSAAWDPGPIGFSISEPLFSDGNYYPEPTSATPTSITYQGGATVATLDTYTTADPDPFDNNANRPLGRYGLPIQGSTANFSTVILQRLADPTQAWNPEPTRYDADSTSPTYQTYVADTRHNPALPVNPYITIDYMPFDLSVFKGEYTMTGTDMTEPGDPGDNAANIFTFRTRERGGDVSIAGSNVFNLWKADSSAPQDSFSLRNGAANVPFKHNLDVNTGHTLGFINGTYHNTTELSPYYTTTTLPAGYPAANYLGAAYPTPPASPFPWLTWNNRPYTGAMELLQVPSTSAGRLLSEFDWRHANVANITPGTTTNHYTTINMAGTTAPPFPHLMTMLYSGNTEDYADYKPSDPSATGSDRARANLVRIFDYVGAPSRFSGTDMMLNPAAEWGNGAGSLPFHPPFNRISNFREPGKININTLFDPFGAPLTTLGITNGDPGSTALFNKIVASRRGYGDPTAAVQFNTVYDDDSPTIFMNPFRSHSHNYPEVIPALRNRNAGAPGYEPNVLDDPGTGPTGRRRFHEPGFLRPDPAESDRPLFAVSGPATATDAWSYQAEAFRDADRNPYFAYKMLQKIDNVFTTRSNVYAIWITVGYFEVTPTTVSQYYPDGYTLGAELGSDTGDIKRHRAFFLFDRSIPVAFQRGYDHNVQKALLIQRVIE